MKIYELVEMYKKDKMLNFKKALEVTEYIGIAYKKKIAELVLNECITEVDGNLQMNSLDRYILFIIAVIGAHTNLEFNNEDDDMYSAIDDFDTLNENHLLEKIVDTFREDYDACQIVLDMMTSDRIKNHITLEKKINSFITGFGEQLVKELQNLENKDDIIELFNSIGQK